MSRKNLPDNLKYVYASKNDFAEITALWQEAFGDDETFIADYFERWYSEKRILLCKVGDTLAAMASLIPVKDSTDSREYIYIYALAVKTDFRGRGIAADMLDYIQTTQKMPLLLQPEKNGVEKFYEAIGFETMPAEKLDAICVENGITELTLGVFDGYSRKMLFYDVSEFRFSEILPDKFDDIARLFFLRPNRSCVSTPLCLYLYRHIYKAKYCLVGNSCMVTYSEKTQQDNPDAVNGRIITGAIPYCNEADLPHYFKLQEKYFNEVLHLPHTVLSADEEGVELLRKSGTLDNYEAIHVEKYRDYLYDGESMRTLAGRKLAKKRNLISQFMRNYENRWEYFRLTIENRREVLDFLDEWYEKRGEHEDDEMLKAEMRGIADVFEHESLFESFRFGGIRIDGRLKAFSIGAYNEREKMAIIDVEKADRDITGLYQLINREFLVHEFPDAQLVNREDDVGEENLRRAKMSYGPIDFEHKYTLKQKDF